MVRNLFLRRKKKWQECYIQSSWAWISWHFWAFNDFFELFFFQGEVIEWLILWVHLNLFVSRHRTSFKCSPQIYKLVEVETSGRPFQQFNISLLYPSPKPIFINFLNHYIIGTSVFNLNHLAVNLRWSWNMCYHHNTWKLVPCSQVWKPHLHSCKQLNLSEHKTFWFYVQLDGVNFWSTGFFLAV